MENYEILNQLGDGTFGCVVKALHRKTGQIVAIKKMKQKYYSWDDCVKLPEVAVMRRIHGHPNIVKMREVIRESNELFFVLEYMDGDLLGVIRKAKQLQNPSMVATAPPIPYPKIRSYVFQIFQALAYVHQRGYFHRDLKPENLLVKKDPTSSAQEIVKLADFGLVKEVRARPPYTDYVSTRWYRAPELLLQDRAYSCPVDVWAAACILAELITTRPLFAGSNEVDQLHKIMSVLGSPNEQIWPEGMALARKIRYSFPAVKGVGLEHVLPSHVPPKALDLMKQILQYDPKKRPTAQQCLQHPYFNIGLDEENCAPPSVAMQLANAAKKYAPNPQTAPPGNVLLPNVNNARRSPVGAATASPKPGGVGILPLLSPLQKLCSSTGADMASAFASEKVDCSPSASKMSPTCLAEGYNKRKDIPAKGPASSTDIAKSVAAGGIHTTRRDDNDNVDLDGLMKEFEGELETLGIVPQQKQHTACFSFNEPPKKENPHKMHLGKPPLALNALAVLQTEKEEDIVESFLNGTRYKRSSLHTKENGAPLHPTKRSSLQRHDPLLPPSPSALSGGHHALSPSIKALLAKHMKQRDGAKP